MKLEISREACQALKVIGLLGFGYAVGALHTVYMFKSIYHP